MRLSFSRKKETTFRLYFFNGNPEGSQLIVLSVQVIPQKRGHRESTKQISRLFTYFLNYNSWHWVLCLRLWKVSHMLRHRGVIPESQSRELGSIPYWTDHFFTFIISSLLYFFNICEKRKPWLLRFCNYFYNAHFLWHSQTLHHLRNTAHINSHQIECWNVVEQASYLFTKILRFAEA